MGDLLKVRAIGVSVTRRVAVWAVRRRWKDIVVFFIGSKCLIMVESIGGREG